MAKDNKGNLNHSDIQILNDMIVLQKRILKVLGIVGTRKLKTNTKLDNIKSDLGNIKSDLDNIKSNVDNIKSDLDNIKSNVGHIKITIGEIKTQLGSHSLTEIFEICKANNELLRKF